VNHGDDLTFAIIPDLGYEIQDVQVDGISVGPLTSFTFNSITEPHTIHATFVKVVEVLDVNIPNGTMKIGDVVSASISVSNDASVPYSMISGNIGGYPLIGFQRINATSYLANFVITEGGNSYQASQQIPVNDLVITDGTIQSNVYNGSIVQNNDLLDAEYPQISSVTVESGTKRIGSVVVLNINADGSGYTILPGSGVNGISVAEDNVTFLDQGGGNYTIAYTVEEGDNDVEAGELEASIILAKPSGNIGAPYTLVANAQNLTIDAHPPVITGMEVSNRAYGVGQTIQIAITADGTGYSAMVGTLVNGIPLSSARVSFTERAGGLYELTYTIDANDSDVSPGQLAGSLVLSDVAGNTGIPFGTFNPNSLEIYTALPEAVIAGTPEICEGEPAALSVSFQGRGPWSFTLSDGTITTNYDDIATDNYLLTVEPVQSTTYQIASVEDVNGVMNTGRGQVDVLVNQKSFVEFVNIASGYSVEEDPVQLLANIPGGTFSGPGIVSPDGMFDPALADTIGSPHTITYTYSNEQGCISQAEALVFVLGTMGGVFIPSQIVCSNGEPFMVNASNVAAENGSFKLLNSNGQAVAGLTDFGDNSAEINPAILSAGTYTIEYRYFEGVVHIINKTFQVETVQSPLILNLTDDSYCQNITPFILEGNEDNTRFEGPGVHHSPGQGYLFNPSDVAPGEITIYCENLSDHGCSEGTEKLVEIRAAPAANFAVTDHCIPASGGMVSFDNLTPEKLMVESWSWDFGDPESGPENTSTDVNPIHFFGTPGDRIISLEAITHDGCARTYEMRIILDLLPQADFTWISDCYSPDQSVSFVDRSGGGSSVLNHFQWTFRDFEGTILGRINTQSGEDTVDFTFDGLDIYGVDLITETELGCTDSVFKEVLLQPTILVTDEGYREGFNGGDGAWKVQSEDGLSSWVLREPDFTGFAAIAGDMAWVTQFPAGVIGYREHSWIQSPCFDFSNAERSMIQMNIMRSFVPSINGAVLQYRDVVEEGWKNVGGVATGVSWYNSADLISRPGGSDTGWGLEVFNPDQEWVRAAHALDDLDGLSNISFRIAIASTGAQGIGNQGFAFDDIFIGKRSMKSVVEYFTNSSSESSRLADDLIDSLSQEYSSDIIDLQYHTSNPGQDPMNENNPYPASIRKSYYGIEDVPYAVLNGGSSEEFRYQFTDLKATPLLDYIGLAVLEVPQFQLDLTVDRTTTGLESRVEVTCLTEEYANNIQLYTVIFEREVTMYEGENGDTTFRNVVLDMLPNPTGKLLGGDWESGDSENSTGNWEYQPYVEDIRDLGVAAFIQDRRTGKILQAAVNYRKWDVGLETTSKIPALNVYPNPAKNELFVNLGRITQKAGLLRVMDMNGREVMAEQIPAGYQIHRMHIEHLDRGIYILYWMEGDQLSGLNKFIKTE